MLLQIKKCRGGGYGCHDPAKKEEKQESSESAGEKKKTKQKPDITTFLLQDADAKVVLPNITKANKKPIHQIKQLGLFLCDLYMIGRLWVLAKENPCPAQELVMTVYPGLVASQVVFASEHENMQKCSYMQELAKKMGTSIDNLEKDLSYMGIAIRYCPKTGMRAFAFLLDKWNTQCPRLGKNGTQGGSVKERPIDSLKDLPDELYKIICDLLNKATQVQHANMWKQEESSEAGGGARLQPLAMGPSSSPKSDFSATGKVEATEMPSVSAPVAVVAVTSWRKRALKQDLPSGEQGSRRTKARSSGEDQTLGEEAGHNKAGDQAGLAMSPAITQVKPDPAGSPDAETLEEWRGFLNP